MINLTEAQKEILIFLLIAVIMMILTCFISYCVWEKICLKQIKRRRQRAYDNADDFPVDNCDNYNSSPNSSWEDRQAQARDENHRPLNHSSLQPTAPSLDSFRISMERSSAADTSHTTGISTLSDSPLLQQNTLPEGFERDSARLPSYAELMQERIYNNNTPS